MVETLLSKKQKGTNIHYNVPGITIVLEIIKRVN